MDGSGTNQDQYIDSAVRAVTNKRPIPEIDFTLHTMEDGTQVSTQERVCKGKLSGKVSKAGQCERSGSALSRAHDHTISTTAPIGK